MLRRYELNEKCKVPPDEAVMQQTDGSYGEWVKYSDVAVEIRDTSTSIYAKLKQQNVEWSDACRTLREKLAALSKERDELLQRNGELEQQSVRDGHINSALDNAANVMAEKLYGEPKPFVVPEWAQAKNASAPATSPHRLRADHSVKVEVILTPYSANMTFKVDPCTISIMDRIIFGFLFEPVPDKEESISTMLLWEQWYKADSGHWIIDMAEAVQRFEAWLRTNGYLRTPDVQATGYQTIDELVDEWIKMRPSWNYGGRPSATNFGNWLRDNGRIKDPSDRGSINERAMIIRSAHAYADSIPDGEGRNAVRRFADSLNSGGMS